MAERPRDVRLPGVDVDGVRTSRRPLDAYYTPPEATRALLRHWGQYPLEGLTHVLEPCAGHGDIARVLRGAGWSVATNDLDVRCPSETHLDATRPDYWPSAPTSDSPTHIVTNPPYREADTLVPLAVQTGATVAMLLRLSWLEPTRARAAFLEASPPDQLIVLPRLSFTGNGRCDNVTSAWFVWHRLGLGPAGIAVVPRTALERP